MSAALVSQVELIFRIHLKGRRVERTLVLDCTVLAMGRGVGMVGDRTQYKGKFRP